MRSLSLLFMTLCVFSSGFIGRSLADELDIPGRIAEQAEPVSPDDWFDTEGGGGLGLLSGPNTNEVQITPEIQNLARALNYDPVQLYNYVRNNIDYVPLFGARNGATATFLAKKGNDLDQCSLLIALLKASSPSMNARYIETQVVYPTSFLSQLLGVDTNQVLSLLGKGLIPAQYHSGNPSFVHMYRYWVEATINGTNYVLDTAFKEYDATNAVDILSIAGYSRTQFMARAVSGATLTTNSIKNAHESNIRADLMSLSTNVIKYIEDNHPHAGRDAILGGRWIRHQEVSVLPTSLPYATQIFNATRNEYSVLPANYYWRINIQHNGINHPLRVYEFAGKRVSIFYTGTGNAPQLRVDGTLMAAGTSTVTGQVYAMSLVLSRPNAAPITNTFSLTSGRAYVIANDFGAVCPTLMAGVSKELARNRANGLPETSEAVLGGSLHLMSLSYLNQLNLQQDLTARLMDIVAVESYDIGLVAQEAGYYIDIPMSGVGITHRMGNATNKETAFLRSTSLMLSALEHGMLEQMQGTNRPGASSVKLLRISNANNKETYFGNNSNWSGASGVKTQLVNYSLQELAQLDSLVSAGYTVIVPKDASITLMQWVGLGYIAYLNQSISMTIRGGYKGGYGGVQAPVQSSTVQNQTAIAYVPLPPADIPRPQSAEPVDLASGDYLFENTDLALGGDEPRGLKLVRSYNSSQSYIDSRLRYGWTHNYDMRAALHSNPDAALGIRQATDAAAFAVYSLIAADLLENELNIRGWMAATLATKWAMDQLIENAVSIQMGARTLSFIKLVDGSYNSPPGVTASLTGSNGAFRLHERFGVRYDFNANNRISSWRDADTNIMAFSYNAQTNLSSVADMYGRTLTFTYSGGTQLTSVADSSSRSVSYGYSGGNLTSYTDPEGKVWSYAYDSNRWMRTLADPLSQITASNTYNTVGMVVTQRNAAGFSWAFYVAPNYRSIEQDPFGGQIRYFFNREGRQTAKEDTFSNRWSYAYDGQGHVTNEINPRGFLTAYQYDDNHNRTNIVNALTNATAFTYDAQDRLIAVRDALGNATQYGYDAEHHVTNIVDALGHKTAFTYQPNGLVQSVTGPRGETTGYTYDSFGNPASITRADGGTETRTWNARGDLLTRTDANSNTTTFTYDRRRLLTSERDALNRAVSNRYNNVGLLVTNTDKRGFGTIFTYTPTYKVASVRYPDGGVVSNFYDAADRLVATRDPMGFVTTNQYDLAGRLIRVINPLGHAVSNTYDQAGNVLFVRDQAGNLYSSQYDALNRQTRSVDPLGNVTSNHYNAVNLRVAAFDPDGKKTEFQYDAAGRVTLERRVNLDHVFEYDASGNRIAYVNPKSERIGFGFDKMNRLVATTNAIGKITRYVYDPAGNLKQKINANGQTNVFAYNAVNQLINRLSGSENVSFWYNPNGSLTNMTDSLGTTKQTFDAMNRLTQVTDPFGQTVGYQYNLAGARTQIVYPDGKTQTFTYDGVYRLTNSAASSFGLSAANYGYDSRNNLTGASLPGELTRSNSYDAANRLTAWSLAKAGSNLLARANTRNPLGFRTSETISAGLEALDAPASQTHQHDAADRITGIVQSGPGATNVPSYDAAGNLTQLVYSVMGQTFATRYGYDFNNRLVDVARLRNAPNGSMVTSSMTQLEYDGVGLLLRLTENGNIRRLVRDRIDSLARPLVEIGATTNAVRWFVWSNGKLLAQVHSSNGTVRVAHSDELGKVLALTDGTGTLTDEFAYQPYGRLIAHSGTTDLPFAYMGDYGVLHAGQGLYLTRHRAYDANLARFLQSDPLGIDGGWNLYVYANGNPVMFIDPAGLQAAGPINGIIYHPYTGQPLPTDGPVPLWGSFLTGTVLGGLGAVAVVAGGPVLASGLVSVGVPASTAVGAVDTALLVGGGVGAYMIGKDTWNAAQDSDWNRVAFNAGSMAGGLLVGAGGGGRALAEGLMGKSSPAPNTWNPAEILGYEWSMGYRPNYPNGSLGAWMGSAPTPAGGAAASAFIGSASSSRLQK